MSDDGTLVMTRGVPQLDGVLSSMDGEGTGEPITSVDAFHAGPLLSPDGRLLASAAGRSPQDTDVWIHDLQRGSTSRITQARAMAMLISFSPDGTELAVVRFTPGEDFAVCTYFYAVNGSGETRDPYDAPLMSIDATWSRALAGDDARRISARIRLYSIEDRTIGDPIVETKPANGVPFAISPDGRHALLAVRDADSSQIVCIDLPDGRHPIWGRDGTTVYYREGDVLMSVRVTYPDPVFGRPEPVFPESVEFQPQMGVAVTRDGERFVVVRPSDELIE